MRFEFATNIYTKAMNPKQIKGYRKKIKQGKPDISLFLIIMPIEKTGLLEIYWYNSLLQPYYRAMDTSVKVVGMAHSKKQADKVVCELVEDMYQEQHNFDVEQFFKNSFQ